MQPGNGLRESYTFLPARTAPKRFRSGFRFGDDEDVHVSRSCRQCEAQNRAKGRRVHDERESTFNTAWTRVDDSQLRGEPLEFFRLVLDPNAERLGGLAGRREQMLRVRPPATFPGSREGEGRRQQGVRG